MITMPAFVLTRMAWPEVRSALETVRLAIIPTDSCEQHGSNMTLEADAASCYALAERLAQRLYPHALPASLLPWGISAHHVIPGTITLRPETYNAVLWDVVASLKSHGLSFKLPI